ncbi:MarR family winged helix-turn-helix transcriptional regulator [Kordiimonas marina]|uniref:MarR family winged helix-turn-helix transcriptional regulator n=1 Tax=Kordiimonas marina TaxID=2872312 RepID=UPI001FF22EAE|nr:MarR family winged helix-turn-helix transcriptional regulator [Kordiimonas marina]MCJ9429067.1 MarR family winged helix-turn-helix transcriptional regulator [Kordiimonas marina]
MEKKLNGTLILGEFLPYRLSVLSNRISRAIADRYEERFQLSMPEWRVMAVVGEETDLSAGQVAERTAMDKVAVSRAVSKLLQSGRLERHFAPDDKRRSVLALSEAGKEVYREVGPIAVEYEHKIMEKLTSDEKALLNSLLNKLDDIQLHT